MAACALASWTAISAADWPMFHGDRRHSGLATASSPTSPIVAWSHPTSDSMHIGSPVVGPDGTIYAANRGGELVALRNVGNRRWTFVAPTSLRYSTPAVAADGTVYVGGSNDTLYAVNPDGTLKWTFAAGGPIKTSPNIAADGTVYFGADDGKLYAIGPGGFQAWTYQTGDTIRSSPAIGPDGTIFFGSEDFYFYALNPNGTLRWRAATGNVIKYCSPAVSSGGIVYFGSYDGYLYAVSSAGALQWAYYTAHVMRSSPAIGADGVIYVGVDDDLRAINPNGTLRWKFTTLGEIHGSPAYTANDGMVTIGSDDGVLYAIHADASPNDGELAWQYAIGKPIRSSPAPTNAGNIIIGDAGGRVWAFGPLSTLGVAGHAEREPELRAEPNPSLGGARFRPVAGLPDDARLEVFDVRGRRVAVLSRGPGGDFEWNGRDARQVPVAAGIYLYRVEGRGSVGRLAMLR